jgi:hypothetical protein
LSGDFIDRTVKNPSWCKTITEPLIVDGQLNCWGSEITHLSPLITFTDACNFDKCMNLKVATGKFREIVGFSESGIEEIRNLVVENVSGKYGDYVANFDRCERLKVASGTYTGEVSFWDSSVEEIGDLVITDPGPDGQAVGFVNCKRLKVATGTFPGMVDFRDSGVVEIRDLIITETRWADNMAALFDGCHIQKVSNFKYNGGIDILAKIQQLQGQEKAGGKGEFDDLF